MSKFKLLNIPTHIYTFVQQNKAATNNTQHFMPPNTKPIPYRWNGVEQQIKQLIRLYEYVCIYICIF